MAIRAKLMMGGMVAVLLAGCTTSPDEPEPLAESADDMIVVTGSRVGSADRASAPRPSPSLSRFVAASPAPMPPPPAFTQDRDEFRSFDTNPVQAVADAPVSTFSIDVDTASYAVARSSLNNGQLPPSDAVRVEEVINYFDYAYPLPESMDAPFAASVTVMDTPWNPGTQLMHVGIQGYDVTPAERPRANLVFLMDVSGSMNAQNKLPLAVESLRMLLEQLDEEDRVSIVVYAGAAGVVLEPTPATDREVIDAALNRLRAGGSTAGGQGLALAYSLAEKSFDADAVNRIILTTDGDFNVGVTRDESLEDFVARKRETGIYLSVMGFGRGNYNDALMQTIAQAGNGTAGYIDTLSEARRMLVEESSSTLFPIANDVKIQVEFNPARVAEYRLIGYESRMLEEADFNNDAVDAGEIGSGHSVTAIYEITAPDSDARQIDPRRYQDAPPAASHSDEFAFLRLRYKQPGEDESQLIETPVTQSNVVEFDRASDDVRLSVAAAAYAQLLRNDPYLGEFSYADVVAIAEDTLGEDPYGYRAEFLKLAERAGALTPR